VTDGHAKACIPPGSEMLLLLCQLCAGFVHELGAFSARIVQTFGAKRADFLHETCADLAGIAHDSGTKCALRLLLDSFSCSMVRGVLLAAFPAMRMCSAAARSGQGRVSDGVNP
jgi:hypothetical protein